MREIVNIYPASNGAMIALDEHGNTYILVIDTRVDLNPKAYWKRINEFDYDKESI